MDTNLPFISVVVPVYNEQEEIEELLDSLMVLDWPQEQYEIICCDNGSTDRSREIMSSYPILVLEESKPGPYPARNRAIKQAKGEFIALTDADCIVSQQWLRDLYSGFTSDAVGAVAGSFTPKRLSNHIDYFMFRVLKSPNHNRGSKKVASFTVTGNVMYRKEVFDNLGLFDEDTFSGSDVDMSWRLLDSGKYTQTFLEGEKGLVYHNYHTDFRSFFNVLERDAYGWFFLTLRYPHLAPIPSVWKYSLKFILGLLVLPWMALARLLLFFRAEEKSLFQELMWLVVLWQYFIGTLRAKRVHQGLLSPSLLR